MSTENSDCESNTSDLSDLSVSSDENLAQTNNLELTGEILNNYNIICELGRGASSIVWLVYNITNDKFYAMKVQDPSEYKAGVSEIQFVQKLPKNPNVFNNIIEHFTEIRNKNKYLCSVWELHCSNLDSLLRKGQFKDGFPINMVNSIMKQLVDALCILHRKFKVFHGDIKTDNIFVKGINDKDMYIIDKYKSMNFFDLYSKAKKDYWNDKGKSLERINDMKREDKLMIRKIVHKNITKKVLDLYETSGVSKYSINNMYLDDIKISLGDFGTHCSEDNYYEEPFGTRYYMAPEIILMGKCSLPVDIWALGCTFYELITGQLLFDPEKDSHYSRDYYHLQLISETCGHLSHKCIKKTKYYKKFFTTDYMLIDYKEPEQNRLERKMQQVHCGDKERIIFLLKGMLETDPSKRLTIETIAKMQFF